MLVDLMGRVRQRPDELLDLADGKRLMREVYLVVLRQQGFGMCICIVAVLAHQHRIICSEGGGRPEPGRYWYAGLSGYL